MAWNTRMSDAAIEARRRYYREWRERNRDHVREYNRNWKIENREKLMEKEAEYWERKAAEYAGKSKDK